MRFIREVRRHQDLHRVDSQDAALQLRARRPIRETVQEHVTCAGLNSLKTQPHTGQEMKNRLAALSHVQATVDKSIMATSLSILHRS